MTFSISNLVCGILLRVYDVSVRCLKIYIVCFLIFNNVCLNKVVSEIKEMRRLKKFIFILFSLLLFCVIVYCYAVALFIGRYTNYFFLIR